MFVKKYSTIFSLLVAVLVGPVASGNPLTGKNYTFLHQKDPRTWSYDLQGAWGKLAWITTDKQTRFVFDGRKLRTKFQYTLIYFPDPIPGEGLICIGTSKSDRQGNLHIEGKVFGPLPKQYDKNFGVGAKIWLVHAADLSCRDQKFVKGNPEYYLYGTRWIKIP